MEQKCTQAKTFLVVLIQFVFQIPNQVRGPVDKASTPRTFLFPVRAVRGMAFVVHFSHLLVPSSGNESTSRMADTTLWFLFVPILILCK